MGNKSKKALKWVFDNLGIVLTGLTLLFMFWQAWRDIFTNVMEIKERVTVIEQKLWPKEK